MKASYQCAVILIRVFAGCTCGIVGFAVLWLWLTCEFDILTAQYFMIVKQYFTKKQWFYNNFFFFLN